MILLVAALAVLSTPPRVVDLSGLRLSLTTTRPTVLAGEATRVAVTWSTTSPVTIVPDFLKIVYAAPGAEPVEWWEATDTIACGIPASRNLGPGDSFVTSHVMAARGRVDFSRSSSGW